MPLGLMRTGAWPDVRHVNEGSCALDEGRVVQGDAGAETLRVDSLAELSIGHRDGGFVISWGKGQSVGDLSLDLPRFFCSWPLLRLRKARMIVPIREGRRLSSGERLHWF